MKKYNVTISIKTEDSKLNEFLWALWAFCNEQLKKPSMRNIEIAWSELTDTETV